MATVQIQEPQRLLIGGAWVDAGSGRLWDSSGPVEGEPSSPVAAAGAEDVRRAVEAAAAAFPAWAAGAPAGRRSLLNAAASLLEERAEEIAGLVTVETGGTFGWGMFNVQLAAGMLREGAAQAYGAVGEVIPSDLPGVLAMGIRQPAGVVAALAPWNAPVILGVRAVAMPLAYGNTVVLKASEECPRVHAAIARVLVDAGFPAGVVNLIVNEPSDAPEVVDELIAHPAVRRINFTGSTRVGRIIAEKAGKHLKRVLLELGGKAPLVVLDDADLDEAAAAANFGAFFHQGQICMSTERIVVDRSVSDDLCTRLADRASALVVGDPREPSTQIGPMINEASLQRVTELVDDARSHGASVLCGGSADGLNYTPTVLTGVTPADAAVRRGVVRPGGHGRGRRRDRRGGARGQRHRVRAVRRRLRPGRPAGLRCRPPARDRHLPRQRRHRPRRAADAVRRRQGVGLRPLRGPGRPRGVHRAALDHRRRAGGPPLPDLGVELAVHLPLMPFGEPLSLQRLEATADAARECGFAAVAANDHLVFQTPWLDGLAALASVVGRSGEMELATTIALVSVRGPAPLAKALTALDVLSDGRVVAGVGPGSSERDHRMVGAPFEERWKRFDEAIGALRALLEEGDLEPRRRDRIPLWIGSWGSDAGLARVARAADGWLASAYNTTPEGFAAARAKLAGALEERGRDPDGFPNALATMWTWVSKDRAEADRVLAEVLAPILRRDPDTLREQVCVGPAGHCAELLARYAEAGCERVYVWPLGDEARQIELLAAA